MEGGLLQGGGLLQRMLTNLQRRRAFYGLTREEGSYKGEGILQGRRALTREECSYKGGGLLRGKRTITREEGSYKGRILLHRRRALASEES